MWISLSPSLTSRSSVPKVPTSREPTLFSNEHIRRREVVHQQGQDSGLEGDLLRQSGAVRSHLRCTVNVNMVKRRAVGVEIEYRQRTIIHVANSIHIKEYI